MPSRLGVKVEQPPPGSSFIYIDRFVLRTLGSLHLLPVLQWLGDA